MSQHSVSNLEPKQLIGQVTYGPDILRVLFQAFDEAWKVMAPRCGENPLAIYAARLKLANAILGLARKDIQDPGAIRDGALKLLGGN